MNRLKYLYTIQLLHLLKIPEWWPRFECWPHDGLNQTADGEISSRFLLRAFTAAKFPGFLRILQTYY